MKYLCIDPGPVESGYVTIEPDRNIHRHQIGIIKNNKLVYGYQSTYSHVIIEMIASYGMPVGKSSFDTVLWIGRFMQYFQSKAQIILITRKEAKKTISSGSAKDANIRQALIDRYPATGGGKTPQIGTKKQPGPLYGMKSHCWQALALGHAFLDGCEHYNIGN